MAVNWIKGLPGLTSVTYKRSLIVAVPTIFNRLRPIATIVLNNELKLLISAAVNC